MMGRNEIPSFSPGGGTGEVLSVLFLLRLPSFPSFSFTSSVNSTLPLIVFLVSTLFLPL